VTERNNVKVMIESWHTMLMSEFLQDDVQLLKESDIPGASLNEKNPSELNLAHLR